jgi:hypothetical protein
MISLNLHGQCTGLTQGSGTATTEGGTLPTGTINWTAAYKYITTDLIIPSGCTLNISASDIKVKADVTITVQNGGILNISAATDIYGEPAGASFNLWYGIVVDGGGKISVNASQLFYARTAIQASNSSSLESEVDVTGSCFENNEIGIYFGPNQLYAASNSAIDNSEFTAPALVDDLAGQVGDYGVLVFLTDHTYGITIGNTSTYDPTSDNYFHLLGMGIRAYKSDVMVQNCYFTDINYNPAALHYPSGTPFTETLTQCYGVCASAPVTTFPPNLLQVGSATTSLPNNQFIDCRNGIFVDTYVSSEIYNNRIVSSGGTSIVMDDAIQVFNCNQINVSHIIDRNYIDKYVHHGIRFGSATNGTLSISDNTLTGITTAAFQEYAIRVVGSSPTAVAISGNTIDAAITGIVVASIDAPAITGNTVDFYSPNTTTVSYGIRADNCPEVYIFENQVSGNYSSGYGSNVRGIYIETSDGFIADENLIENSSSGYYLNGPSPVGIITCSAIEYNVVGIAMRDMGTDGMGPVGSLLDPSDNSWLPATTANRVYCFGGGIATDGASLNADWVYRTSPAQYNIPNALTTGIIPPSTDFNPSVTSGVGTPCYPSFRMDGDTIARLLETINYVYGQWLSAYMAGDEAPGVYYKAMNYWRFMQKHASIVAYLDDAWLEAYTRVQNSNIPVFMAIADSLAANNFPAAQQINSALSPSNILEQYQQKVNDLQIVSTDTTHTLTLSDDTRSRLLEIATLNGGENGAGVYHARALLDTLIDVTDDDWPERIMEETQTIAFSVFPNPANKYVVVQPNDMDVQYAIDILNIQGIKVKEIQNRHNLTLIDVADLTAGIYILILEQNDNILSTQKLILQR